MECPRGAHPFRPERTLGPTPLLAAVAEHSHTDFRSVTGGYVYHGKRLGELKDGYIYGDYDTGKIWLLRYQNGKVTEHRELADTLLRIVAFGEDPSGELYLVDFISGAIHRLVPNPSSGQGPPEFPRKLSETGLFASIQDHEPAAGLIPYSVNAPLWSDHGHKDRFLALPGDSQIEYNTAIYPQPAPGVPPGWKFPDNTVLVKTFSLEMETGNEASAAGSKPEFCTTSASLAPMKSELRSGRAMSTNGTTNRQKPFFWPPKAAIAASP